MHNGLLGSLRAAIGVLLVMALPALAAGGDRIELPLARFATGDRAEWAHPDFDDSAWKLVKTTQR